MVGETQIGRIFVKIRAFLDKAARGKICASTIGTYIAIFSSLLSVFKHRMRGTKALHACKYAATVVQRSFAGFARRELIADKISQDFVNYDSCSGCSSGFATSKRCDMVSCTTTGSVGMGIEIVEAGI